MSDLLVQLSVCVERGKVDINAPYPPDLKGQEGTSELTQKALQNSIPASQILEKALMPGMRRVGDKFGKGEAFIPDLLIAAKAMNAAMAHLKPYFESGEALHRGTVILGTVSGDLHDIGKNLVKMVLEGEGWKVLDLGTDIGAEKFIKALEDNPDSMVGLSALLTTTMINMQSITQSIKAKFPGTKVFLGGAPLSAEFNDKIGADGYFPDPQRFVRHLDQLTLS